MSGKPKLGDVYPVGARVETLRSDGTWHEAKVVQHRDSQLVLRFHDASGEGDGWDVEKSVKYELLPKKVRPFGATAPLEVELPAPRPPVPAPTPASPPPAPAAAPPAKSPPAAPSSNPKPAVPSAPLPAPDAGKRPPPSPSPEEKHEKSHFFGKLFHRKKK